MTIEELNSSKVPIIVFDKKLEQLRDKVLFPEKLAKANEILSRVGMPKEYYESIGALAARSAEKKDIVE
jgi:hypothetical protein